MVTMVVVTAVVVLRRYHLRLRRQRSCEAEHNDEPEQKLFHAMLDANAPRTSTKPVRPPACRTASRNAI
jgi:hypothetical protein